MLMNNLDPEVAERPEDLVVYGGTGKAARDWESFWAIVSTLQGLDDDETLLVQSGKPVAVFRTHPWAPRVLIANSLLVPEWADWKTFRELERAGLTMYGQMTAGSWIYIGTQGILQGTYETFAAVAEQRFGGTLNGRVCLTAGLGGMGGAQPLAITMNEGVALCVEVDGRRIERRISHGYLDERIDDLDAAIERAEEAKESGEPLSIGILGNAAEVFPALLERGYVPDVVTDQTSAHDPLAGYIPAGYDLDAAAALREADPERYISEARASMASHCAAMVGFQERGAEVFDYGNSLRGEARLGGFEGAYSYPGFVPAYIRPLFCEGKGPFRWAALSGEESDIAATDEAILELFPDDERLARWISDAREKVHFQGLPSRICWLGAGERHRAGLRFNELVADGTISRPHSHRPRPSGHRQRRLTLPRDGGDEGRLRRHRGLAHPERHARTSPAGRAGSRSTTAEASGSDAPSTPAPRSSPTAPKTARPASSACSSTTPESASSATPTRATSRPRRRPGAWESRCRCWMNKVSGFRLQASGLARSGHMFGCVASRCSVVKAHF